MKKYLITLCFLALSDSIFAAITTVDVFSVAVDRVQRTDPNANEIKNFLVGIFDELPSRNQKPLAARFKEKFGEDINALIAQRKDATRRFLEQQLAACRTQQPPVVEGFDQAYAAMLKAKDAFEADVNNTTNLTALKNAIKAVDASTKTKALTQEQEGMILVSKCVFNVFAKQDPFAIDKKNPDEVLTIAINLTDKTNIQVRNAIAAAYFALSTDQEKQKVADAFKAHFGQDIKAIGLAVLVGKFKDNAQLQSSYKQLKECDPVFAQAETMVASGK